MDGGLDCPVDTCDEGEWCDMPECDWTDWGAWGECSGGDCGLVGTKSRTRDCIPDAVSDAILSDLSAMVFQIICELQSRMEGMDARNRLKSSRSPATCPNATVTECNALHRN